MIPLVLVAAFLVPLFGAALVRRTGAIPVAIAASAGGLALLAIGQGMGPPRVPAWLGLDAFSGGVALAVAAVVAGRLIAERRHAGVAGRDPRLADRLLLLQGLTSLALVQRDLRTGIVSGVLLIGALVAMSSPPRRRVLAWGLLGAAAASWMFSVSAVREATGHQASVSGLPDVDRVAFNALVEQRIIVADPTGRWGYLGPAGASSRTSDLTTLESLARMKLFEAPSARSAGIPGSTGVLIGISVAAAFALLALALTRMGSAAPGLLDAFALAAVAHLSLRFTALIPATVHAQVWAVGVVAALAVGVLVASWRWAALRTLAAGTVLIAGAWVVTMRAPGATLPLAAAVLLCALVVPWFERRATGSASPA